MRRFAVLALVLVAALSQASPAAAHGGASVTIHSDGRGSVWITARWQDGHPINEPTPVTLTATPADAAASGASGAAGAAGPSGGGASPIAGSRLTQTGDERGTQTWSGVLPPGSWRVAIDLGAPVEGHCQALVPSAPSGAEFPSGTAGASGPPGVAGPSGAAGPSGGPGAAGGPGASPQPVEVACLIPATAATGPAEEAASSTGSLAPLWVTLGVLLIAGLIGAEAVRRRRRREPPQT